MSLFGSNTFYHFFNINVSIIVLGSKQQKLCIQLETLNAYFFFHDKNEFCLIITGLVKGVIVQKDTASLKQTY